MTDKIIIKEALENINSVILNALLYKSCHIEKLNQSIHNIDFIINNPSNLKACETHMKSSNLNLLFYISNIIYNLKTKNELVLTPDVLRWLCSVWKNFLIRNKAYQNSFATIEKYRISFAAYYPEDTLVIQQLENSNGIKEEYLIDDDIDDSPLVKLHNFQQQLSEILNWMRPTYFFLLDFYYERALNQAENNPIVSNLEKEGLGKFGQSRYTYEELSIILCQALGILEGLYLFLKKKKTSRRIINIDGKQKFLSTQEIYKIYLDKFNKIKKEISILQN